MTQTGQIPPIAIVTGANRGIGLEVVRQLASKNVTVILALSRDTCKILQDGLKITAIYEFHQF